MRFSGVLSSMGSLSQQAQAVLPAVGNAPSYQYEGGLIKRNSWPEESFISTETGWASFARPIDAMRMSTGVWPTRAGNCLLLGLRYRQHWVARNRRSTIADLILNSTLSGNLPSSLMTFEHSTAHWIMFTKDAPNRTSVFPGLASMMLFFGRQCRADQRSVSEHNFPLGLGHLLRPRISGSGTVLAIRPASRSWPGIVLIVDAVLHALNTVRQIQAKPTWLPHLRIAYLVLASHTTRHPAFLWNAMAPEQLGLESWQ